MKSNRQGTCLNRQERVHAGESRKKRTLKLESLEKRYAMASDLLSIESMLGSAFNTPQNPTICTCSLCTQIAAEERQQLEVDAMTDLPSAADPTSPEATLTTRTPVDLTQTFNLHSNPGAKQRIYLDFNGHTTSNTTWNSAFRGGADIVTPAYNTDGNASAFSTSELENIQWIWERVAEDFIPFDVDVTTEDPGSAALIKTSSSDAEWGVRVVIGGSSQDWYGATAGGVAYVGSFTWGEDAPAFVFPAQLSGGVEKYVAEAISHETGHTLGLSHDGRSSPVEEYYRGQGSGATSWAPIMGSAYYKNVTQWSRGEYANSSNGENDLTIITTQNGFGYRIDDHGSSKADASLLTYQDTTIKDWGIISQVNDADVFSFYTGAGSIQINAQPIDRGPNLDISLELLDSAFNVLTTVNPADLLSASLNWTVSAAQYYIRVSGAGAYDPVTTGYSNYASLGQYFLSGTLVTSANDILAITATDTNKSEGNSGGSSQHSFKVERSGSLSGYSTVNYSVTGTGNNPATANDFVGGVLPSGSFTFAPGETSRTITINVAGDSDFELNENFSVSLSSPSPTTLIATNPALGSIVNDDLPGSVIVTPTSGLTTSESGTSASFTVALSGAPTSDVVILVSSLDVTEGRVSVNRLVFTANNWNTPQQVVVTGVDDTTKDGNIRYMVDLSTTQSADLRFNGLNVSDVNVTNNDNESTPSKGARKGDAIQGNDLHAPAISTTGAAVTKTQSDQLSATEQENNDKPSVFHVTPPAGGAALHLATKNLPSGPSGSGSAEARAQEKLDAIDSFFADLGL